MKEGIYMVQFLIQNAATIVISLVLAALAVLAIVYRVKKYRRGELCDCGCSGCSHSSECHK